jgi:segregation and condensation protein B
MGRQEGPGKPLLYVTTQEFLIYFGLNSIEDLPKPKELEELLRHEDLSSIGPEQQEQMKVTHASE